MSDFETQRKFFLSQVVDSAIDVIIQIMGRNRNLFGRHLFRAPRRAQVSQNAVDFYSKPRLRDNNIYEEAKIMKNVKTTSPFSKPWEELTFTDNFIFCKVMEDESLCKELLETLLDIKI